MLPCPQRRIPLRTLAAILSLTIATAATAQTAGFWLPGVPEGATSSVISALSRDGSIAAGTINSPTEVFSFGWSRGTGRTDWGHGPEMPDYNTTRALSSDGQVAVGFAAGPPFVNASAFRRIGSGVLQPLGTAGWARGEAFGVSGDGGTIVGWNHSNTGFGEAFRWTEAGGMQPLGYLNPNGIRSAARGISRDGGTIVGYSFTPGEFSRGFRWTESGGMEPLPGLPGAPTLQNEAYRANADGSVIVGLGAATGRTHAIRWVDGVPQDLGILPGYLDSVAWAISDDGSVIGGQCTGVPPWTAFVWTEGTGMVALAEFLAEFGVVLPPNLRLESLHAISGDGLTFAGSAFDTSLNRYEGFVATIPSPASSLVLLLAPALARRRRRALTRAAA